MSIFVSPQDYITMSGDCVKIEYTLCGHTYQFWCKKDKQEDIQIAFNKLEQIVEKNNKKNTGFPFDKILFMSMIDILTKDINNQEEKNTIPWPQA